MFNWFKRTEPSDIEAEDERRCPYLDNSNEMITLSSDAVVSTKQKEGGENMLKYSVTVSFLTDPANPSDAADKLATLKTVGEIEKIKSSAYHPKKSAAQE